MAQPTAQSDRQSRVLLVDDSDAFLRAAASVVAAANRFQLVGSVTSGEEAIRLLPELKPDLVLLDVHMPGINGVETARIIHRQHPEIVVVLMSATPENVNGTARAATAATLIDKAELCPASLDRLLTQRPRRDLVHEHRHASGVIPEHRSVREVSHQTGFPHRESVSRCEQRATR